VVAEAAGEDQGDFVVFVIPAQAGIQFFAILKELS
jgi:hypothetical protein